MTQSNKHTPIIVISDLDKFAFNDIHALLLRFPKLIYEAKVTMRENDQEQYVKQLRAIPKHPKGMIQLCDVFLEEFNEGILRDYVYSYIISFDYIRLDNRVYEINEPLYPIEEFIDGILSQPSYSIEETQDFEKINFSSNFIIFCNPVHEVNDIVIIEKFLTKFRG